MALQFSQQGFYVYGQPHWPEDVKPALTEDDASVLDDRVLDASTPTDMTAADSNESQRPSMAKMERDYSTATHVWNERPHGVLPPARHHSQSSIPLSGLNTQYFGQANPTNYGSGFAHPPSWPLSARSETNTPTPFFATVNEPFAQHVQYEGGPVTFPSYAQQDPLSAVSMSPQSSQGGWASTTSSDAAETDHGMRRRYRGPASGLVLRSDGIRKKNAKFEIPKERNLDNIDRLIMQSTNEEEKRELKQQKRLLRNRQAALDSRQRKKNHTERLEEEKKLMDNQKVEMEESLTQLETTINHEREQWMHQRQQYEQFVQQLQYDRDEAIRTKTLETAELRRQNNVLKDTIRDLERQQLARTYSTNTSDTFSTDFAGFRALDLDDTWEDEFSLINSEDLKMEEPDSLQRQATPRPTASSQQSSMPNTSSVDGKDDAGFSWNTFYMCLLAGAFIVSNTGSQAAKSAPSAAVITSNMPALSDEYRAEAGNVLNAVLATGPEGAHEILPSRQATSSDHSNFQHFVPSAEKARGAPRVSSTALDSLHTSLTTPSREQEAAAAFSLSAASYNHIVNPDGMFDDDDDDEVVEVKPTRLQQLFASMQAERDGLDKMNGMSSKARERSVLLDRVPEKVLRDFREMIARVE
ncbi:hypothetical protein EDD37DRAFT_605124 [Exophiala viscosa]|uniref:uncharacterized protein n=1 Tax=Exophiala viscosa TaxID=2486360 RepID=UPI0021925672|nr:hypothetical protein EDD37DRAFT_605124 [Exophiala viscosa]